MAEIPAPERIFVVDDDFGLVRLLEKSLSREGFVVATAISGKAALSWMAKHTADLMLIDLKLSDMGGNEVVQRMAEQGRAIPFIVITGQGDERVAVQMMKHGAIDYVVKDGKFMELVPAIVRRALQQLEKDKRLLAAQIALRESQVQLLAISEREQRRIGAELHDGLGQILTALEMRCLCVSEDLPPERVDLKEQMSEIGKFLREAVQQTRSLARGLSPVKLGSGGLVEALSGLALHMNREGKVRCKFECLKPVMVEDLQAAAHLYRIAQEAVNNAVKHSQARQIFIRLTITSEGVALEITDNGKGFTGLPGSEGGIGLQIMQHRASVMGADLKIDSTPGRGVSVKCALKVKTS